MLYYYCKSRFQPSKVSRRHETIFYVFFLTLSGAERNVLHQLSRKKKIVCVIDVSKTFKIIILKMESKIGEKIVKGRRRLFPCFLYHMLLQHRKQRPCHQMQSQYL